MIKINSLSGGPTSSFMAVHYPADYNLFALVRVEDKNCIFPDKKIRQIVEDKIQLPFIGTAEMDTIIYTMLDLEQFIGKKIDWVSGLTFEEVLSKKGRMLPNRTMRFCTSFLKLEPMFNWWFQNIGVPVEMRIGYRANEFKRATTALAKCNQNGLSEWKTTFETWGSGRHKGLKKWVKVPWQQPSFPLISNAVFKPEIHEFWKNKPVRFASRNNCVGCFHRNPMLLNKMFQDYPNKMEWFRKMEEKHRGRWRADVSYSEIKKYNPQFSLNFEDFSECDSGLCGV